MAAKAISVSELTEIEALGLWMEWFQDFRREGQEDEIYSVPQAAVRLSRQGEVRFGPELFTAHLMSPGHRKLKGSFLSPGRFGQGFAQFGGNPLSPDSRFLALVGRGRKEGQFCGQVFDAHSGEKLAEYQEDGPVLHHSWSGDSSCWLAQRQGLWLLWSRDKGLTRLVSDAKNFPKHAAFLSSGRLLTFSEARREASVLSVPDVSVLASLSVRDCSGPFFSFPLRNGGLVLGAGARFGAKLSAAQWLVFREGEPE